VLAHVAVQALFINMSSLEGGAAASNAINVDVRGELAFADRMSQALPPHTPLLAGNCARRSNIGLCSRAPTWGTKLFCACCSVDLLVVWNGTQKVPALCFVCNAGVRGSSWQLFYDAVVDPTGSAHGVGYSNGAIPEVPALGSTDILVTQYLLSGGCDTAQKRNAATVPCFPVHR